MRLILPFALISVLIVILALPGCGNANEDYSRWLLPAKGVVRYKGQPLIQGTVSFEPEDSGPEAHGDIQPDGNFVISTFKAGDGVTPGAYRVAIVGKDKAGKQVPVKYRNASSSKLRVEVADGQSDFPLDLK